MIEMIDKTIQALEIEGKIDEKLLVAKQKKIEILEKRIKNLEEWNKEMHENHKAELKVKDRIIKACLEGTDDG